MKTIYVDMDGVLTDFESGYQQVTGKTPHDARLDSVYKQYWDKFLDNKGFTHLPWHTTGERLVEYLNELDKVQLCVLTSSGGYHRHREVMEQKIQWLTDRGIMWPAVVVPGRRFKAGFANDNSLLIDDTLDVITSFKQKDGRAIHHYDTAKTIPLIELFLLS